MIDTAPPEITLAIESAIAGGSLSLLSNGAELDHWTGNASVSRAEELLPNIIEMLERQNLDRKMVGRIAVSLGPGSFTGIRIGIATALGLKNSLGIPCVGISALEAMAASGNVTGTVVAALPVGRDFLCSQAFDVSEQGIPSSLSEPAVAKSVFNVRNPVIVVHPSIGDIISAQNPDSRVIAVDNNLARLVGVAARSFGREDLEPILVQPA
jgi:tRNA threonylcarbamoyl adenosine modification protein YeaZ